MDMWMKVLYAVMLVGMIVFLLPRAKQMLKHSPKAKKGDWNAVLLPLVGIILFVALLTQFV